MKNSQRGIVATALLVVVGLTFVAGGLYVYTKSVKQSADDALIRSAQEAIRSGQQPRTALEMYALLAWEKTRLQMETQKLAQLKAEAIKAALNDVYTGVSHVLLNTEIKASAAVEKKIDAIRAKISKILDGWKILRDVNPGGANTAALQDAIKRDLPVIGGLIEELKDIVEDLTPGNSDMTQPEIDDLEEAIDEAADEIDEAVEDLVEAETGIPPPGSNNPGTPNPTGNPTAPNPIQEQEDIIDEIEDTIVELEDQIDNLPPTDTQPPPQPYPTYVPPPSGGGGGSGGSGYYDYDGYGSGGYYQTGVQSTSGQIIYPPNPAPIRIIKNPGGPQLIDGENDL